MANQDLTPCGVWLRVSSGHQETANQVPDVERFVQQHSYAVAEGCTYTVDDSAWKNGGGPVYQATLQRALDDAWAGKFSVLVIWSLDRIVRQGPEEALRLFRQFRERGCAIVSVKESWLNGSPEVQGLLISFAGWMAQQESRRRSERIKAGIARKQAADPNWRPGRQDGATDQRKRRTRGYLGNQNARKRPDQAG
jgi:DNA invertase Pin-like site-specific DNA recombinase